MKIVTYNIQYGKGRDGRFDLDRVASALTGADVIALQEVERFWMRSGMTDQVAVLAQAMPDYHWVYGANLDMHLDGPPPRRRQFGNMLLSRTPILSSRSFPLPKAAAIGRHSLQRGLLEGVIDTTRGPLRFYATHLDHLDLDLQADQIVFFRDIHRRAPAEGGAWSGTHEDAGWTQDGAAPPLSPEAVLMGDFNLTHERANYALLAGAKTPRDGRTARQDGFVDAWVAAGHDEGEGLSTVRPHMPGGGSRIDHCFVSATLAPLVRGAWIDMAAEGSDHQPLWVEMDL